MTNLLVNVFVKNNKDTKNPTVRTSYGKFAGKVGIACNILLFIIKFIAGILSASIAISADALNNLADASSSIITLIGFKLSAKPADEKHPFGYARYEYITGVFISFLILMIGIQLGFTSIKKIFNPTPVDISLVTVVILLSSIIIKIWMTFFNNKLGKIISSDTLFATATDSRNDAIATTVVLLGGLVTYVSSNYFSFTINLDGYLGLLVSAFILYSGVGIVKETLKPLIGEGANQELTLLIKSEILKYDGILGTHDLMVHDYGPGKRFASVHVEMDCKQNVLESHDIIDDIEREIFLNHNVHLIIHYDPIVTDDAESIKTRIFVNKLVQTIHPDLSIHDFRMVEGPLHTNLIFDITKPFNVKISDTDLKNQAQDIITKNQPNDIKKNYYCVITVDSSFSPDIAQKDINEEKIIHKKDKN